MNQLQKTEHHRFIIPPSQGQPPKYNRQRWGLWCLFMSLSIYFTACQDNASTDMNQPTSTTSPQNTLLDKGVSKALAQQRKAAISQVSYQLFFDISDSLDAPITGQNQISFELAEGKNDLILDFKTSAAQVKAVKMKDKTIDYRFENGHIIVPSRFLQKGVNQVTIDFVAGEQALNRNKEFLYTLFVPDKAATAFPCFDQPNIKASYTLSLQIPEQWVAVTNGKVQAQNKVGSQKRYEYAPTKPISTYLFAFAVGAFESITKTVDGRSMTMYHRETDKEKVARNTPALFDLHAKSLDWLTAYTNMEHPFQKFDFVLIPAFQFGGMEHPGAIYYKSRSLMLDKSATQNQILSRNSLIAHETAHMWFGDLVTMDWFNDVWLKEVFANFMAAKMVNPNFPDIDHDLRFLLRHYPSAYNEDRSQGTHPIQQKLDNLNNAGTLYGRLIYQKAPIVMQQLEDMMGKIQLQQGLQEYLTNFSFDNATWDDLIVILDKRTDTDLAAWSRAWVKEAGMPHIKLTLETKNNKIGQAQLTHENTTKEGSLWQQQLQLLSVKDGKADTFAVDMKGKTVELKDLLGQTKPDFILPNGLGKGYGYFELDERSLSYLLDHVQNIEGNMTKNVAWMSIWEAFLYHKISPQKLMNTLSRALPKETEPLGLDQRLSYVSSVFWGYLNAKQRQAFAPKLEQLLWNLLEKAKTSSEKKSIFNTYRSVVLSDKGVEKLKDLWESKIRVKEMTLSESDYTNIAYALAVRGLADADSILQIQLKDIKNPDRQQEMAFVIPALSADEAVRDAFFESLKDVENRSHESWVLKALTYLHHPLRAKSAEKYIYPSLALTTEIQATGDIFFPKRWLSGTLGGHQSPKAAQIVHDFVQENPDFSFRLKNKLLQAADGLFRKAEIVEVQ